MWEGREIAESSQRLQNRILRRMGVSEAESPDLCSMRRGLDMTLCEDHPR